MKNAFCLIALVAVMMGCGMKPKPAYNPPPAHYQSAEQENKVTGGVSAANDDNQRMVITTVTMKMETDFSDTVQSKVIEIAQKYNGYVLESGLEVTTIRIPASNFGNAIAEIESLGKIRQKDMSGRDVTEEYQDLSTRLDNAEKTRLRYLALLDKAVKVEEILTVEKELERINGNIEFLKGKIDRLSHLVDYCTITVETSEEIKPGPVGYVFYGLYRGIKWLFIWD